MVDAGIYHLSKEAGDNHKFGCLVEAVRDPKIAWELKVRTFAVRSKFLDTAVSKFLDTTVQNLHFSSQ